MGPYQVNFLLSVPFGIDRKSGKIGLVKNIGPKALNHYFVKVQVETPDFLRLDTEIKINVVDPSSMPSKNVDLGDLPHEYSVEENVESTLVANLSRLSQTLNDNGFNEFFIVDQDEDGDAGEMFSVTDAGLLYTKVGESRGPNVN